MLWFAALNLLSFSRTETFILLAALSIDVQQLSIMFLSRTYLRLKRVSMSVGTPLPGNLSHSITGWRKSIKSLVWLLSIQDNSERPNQFRSSWGDHLSPLLKLLQCSLSAQSCFFHSPTCCPREHTVTLNPKPHLRMCFPGNLTLKTTIGITKGSNTSVITKLHLEF